MSLDIPGYSHVIYYHQLYLCLSIAFFIMEDCMLFLLQAYTLINFEKFQLIRVFEKVSVTASAVLSAFHTERNIWKVPERGDTEIPSEIIGLNNWVKHYDLIFWVNNLEVFTL